MEQASEGEKWKQQEWTRKINSHTLQRGPVLFYQIFIKMILNIKYWGGKESNYDPPKRHANQNKPLQMNCHCKVQPLFLSESPHYSSLLQYEKFWRLKHPCIRMWVFFKKKRSVQRMQVRDPCKTKGKKEQLQIIMKKKNENKVHTYKPKADSDCTTDESHIF